MEKAKNDCFLTGSSDCPYYAKVELLADQLAVNLPEFKVSNKIHSADSIKANPSIYYFHYVRS